MEQGKMTIKPTVKRSEWRCLLSIVDISEWVIFSRAAVSVRCGCPGQLTAARARTHLSRDFGAVMPICYLHSVQSRFFCTCNMCMHFLLLK
jgi:hypothetical protein